MSTLLQRECDACRAGAPMVTEEEIKHLRVEIPDWELLTVDGVKRLQRSYKCPNFVEAVLLTNKVAEIAEQNGHHPAILTEWGKVTVTWWTHKIKGLHINDFIMAAKTDRLG